MSLIDKERRIKEMEGQIASLESLSQAGDMDLSQEIGRLKDKVGQLKDLALRQLQPWDKVCLARLRGRPTALDYIEAIFTDFMELHGDRLSGDDPSLVAGLAFLEGRPVTVIGQQKGRDTEEAVKRNFGMTQPKGYRKALRLMKQAEKFKRPVILLVDTPGAFCGIEAEERGQGEAIARNLMKMSQLRVPLVTLILGEGGSGGALALALSDRVYMLENAVYSVLSPEGFSSILWKDASRAQEAAQVMKMTAEDLRGQGIIDGLISEPLGGAQKDPQAVFLGAKKRLMAALEELIPLSDEDRLAARYQRFRRFGSFKEAR